MPEIQGVNISNTLTATMFNLSSSETLVNVLKDGEEYMEYIYGKPQGFDVLGERISKFQPFIQYFSIGTDVKGMFEADTLYEANLKQVSAVSTKLPPFIGVPVSLSVNAELDRYSTLDKKEKKKIEDTTVNYWLNLPPG